MDKSLCVIRNDSHRLTAVVMRSRELYLMNSISSQLPVRYANGVILAKYICQCAICNTDIPDENLRGIIGKPIPSVATIEAAGVCAHCNAAMLFEYRVHDDGSRSFQTPNGRWVRRGRGGIGPLVRRIWKLLCFRA
jgi:hypothetical protein